MSSEDSPKSPSDKPARGFSFLDFTGFVGIAAITGGAAVVWSYGIALIVFGALMLGVTIAVAVSTR